jgi:hypothetical protein
MASNLPLALPGVAFPAGSVTGAGSHPLPAMTATAIRVRTNNNGLRLEFIIQKLSINGSRL